MKQATHLFRESDCRQQDRLRTPHGLAYCTSSADRIGAALRRCYAAPEVLDGDGGFDDLLAQLNRV